MPIKKICLNCNKEYEIKKSLSEGSKYCSRDCKFKFNGWSGDNNTECTQCKKMFHLKSSAKKRYKRTHGYFCSSLCVAKFRASGIYSGSKNPNYKTGIDSDGYNRVESERCKAKGFKKGMRLHRLICCEVLGVENIPKGFHVHHRSCDVRDNTPENLAVLSVSDHKWLHKQYGVAVLWAHYTGKISTEALVEWSDNKDRAARLLDLNVTKQTSNIFKHTTDTERGAGGFGSTGS